MKYLSGIHALNIPCSLSTCGDWHCSTLDWQKLPLRESNGSLLGSYGIEMDKVLPENINKLPVANHIRAFLDLLQDQNFSLAQGACDGYICTNEYDDELFIKVMQLKETDQWDKVKEFMSKEFRMRWLTFYEKNEGNNGLANRP